MQFLLLAGVLLLVQTGGVFAQSEEDVYDEPGWYKFQEKKPVAESAVILPPWPVKADRLEVSLGLSDFPFSLWIDPASISVDRSRVVRYTAILKSVDAGLNVSYEAIDCSDKTYRRYAYGSAGVFKPVRDSQWQRIVPRAMGRFRHVLRQRYLCPATGKKPVDKLIKRLKSDQPALLQDQQEE